MEEKHVDQGRRKFWKTMAGMTWKERFKYFSYYYGRIAICVVILVASACSVLWQMFREKPEILFNGLLVGVELSESAEKIMTEDLFVHLGGVDPEKQEVYFQQGWLDDLDPKVINAMATQLAGGAYDYLLLDKHAMDQLVAWGVYADLTVLLSQETLELLTDKLIYVQDETSEARFPVAINLTDTPFAAQCKFEGKLYIAFPGTNDRRERVAEFFDYFTDCFFSEKD